MLSFREKLELCKLIDRLHVSSIEMEPIKNVKTDSLLIKTVASACGNTRIAVPAGLTKDSIDQAWETVRNVHDSRLLVNIPVSSVQMEYVLHKKPNQVMTSATDALRACMEHTANTELVLEDATRCDRPFMLELIRRAIRLGIGTITFCDTAGILFPEETREFFDTLFREIPELNDIAVGYACSSQYNLSDANAISSLHSGISELKTVCCSDEGISLRNIVKILNHKQFSNFSPTRINTEQIDRITGQIRTICNITEKDAGAPSVVFASGNTDMSPFSDADTKETVRKSAQEIGYDLTDEDLDNVWSRFSGVIAKKGTLTVREFEAIIAAETMQVPPAYSDIQYVINTGNSLGAMSHMKMKYHGNPLEGASVGDGAIDAAFRSIEQAIGRHFELDDFQIQSISEGREAMGETIVKIRADGKLYSGRGISTDIVGASIMAYINAVNKIIFEEEEA